MKRTLNAALGVVVMVAMSHRARLRRARGDPAFLIQGTGLAQAFFASSDVPSACVQTYVGIGARNGKMKTGPATPEQRATTTIFIDRIDTCSGAVILSAFSPNPF